MAKMAKSGSAKFPKIALKFAALAKDGDFVVRQIQTAGGIRVQALGA